ncbi:homoserine dehydrogenase [Bacillota bacterium LX-D]|nr:homoserine dehydrogenase [Bacillota bacterium LX-D]
METIKIGILGCGTVGKGVIKVLCNNRDSIARKIGSYIEIVKVLERDQQKIQDPTFRQISFTSNAYEILDDPEINVIVEVMGGIELPREYIVYALRNGKSVVTANKDLMAINGEELFAAAEEGKADLLFEASVGGGIPIIGPLKESLAGNKINTVMGIINGTTNYILTKMANMGSDFDEVLAEAQKLGYAEADPTSDVEGLDSARKIAILASIAFNTRITFPNVYVEGITKVSASDILYAKELGYVIKLLGIAKEEQKEIEVRVHPVFLPKNHPLASVDNVYNSIYIKGDAVGDAMFFGRGAGELPTASAVVGDIMTIAKNIKNGLMGTNQCTCFEHKRIKTIFETKSKYYLRLSVKDKPGVLASIASVLGNQEVSIASVIQKKRQNEIAEIVLITHEVKEANLQDALNIIRGLSVVNEIRNVIRVESGEE